MTHDVNIFFFPKQLFLSHFGGQFVSIASIKFNEGFIRKKKKF